MRARLCLLALACWALACGPSPPPVPTAHVERRPWRRNVLAEGFLKAASATAVNAPRDVQQALRIEWLLDDGSPVRTGDVVCRFADSDFLLELDAARRDRQGVELKRDSQRTSSEVAQRKAELEVDLAHAELDAAERFRPKDAEVFSRHERIEAELDAELARDRERHADSVRAISERVANGEARLIEVEGRQVDTKEKRAAAGLAARNVTAPHDGLFVLTRNWRGVVPRPGDTVWPGQRLAEIPQTGELVAEVYVLEADAGGLAVDLPATVRLDAHPEVELAAKIQRVDKVAKPRWRGLAVQYFGATLTLDHTDPETMRPGGRVRAWLELARRDEALVIPEAALVEEDQDRLVFRRRGGKFEPVRVVVEGTGGGFAVLADDPAQSGTLAAGDEIALVDPRSDRDRGAAESAEPARAAKDGQ